MTRIGTPHRAERQQFFDGQRLFADDLQQIERYHRQMRELHNRSLHQPGVGSGFAVSGNVGDREVLIGPGYAIDDLGREITLTAARSEPIPPVAGESGGNPAYFDLTVYYPGDDELEASEARQGICVCPGVVRLREDPRFCWVRLEKPPTGEPSPRDGHLAAEMSSGSKVRLARVGVQDCRLKSLSIAERRNARPTQQPYVYCGRQPLVENRSADNDEVVYTVSTSNAAFVTRPHYYVSLESKSDRKATVGTEAIAPPIPIVPVFKIRDPKTTSFQLVTDVLLTGEQTFESLVKKLKKSEPQFDVVWIGVE
jgi:hypothetical protein